VVWCGEVRCVWVARAFCVVYVCSACDANARRCCVSQLQPFNHLCNVHVPTPPTRIKTAGRERESGGSKLSTAQRWRLQHTHKVNVGGSRERERGKHCVISFACAQLRALPLTALSHCVSTHPCKVNASRRAIIEVRWEANGCEQCDRREENEVEIRGVCEWTMEGGATHKNTHTHRLQGLKYEAVGVGCAGSQCLEQGAQLTLMKTNMTTIRNKMQPTATPAATAGSSAIAPTSPRGAWACCLEAQSGPRPIH
jgi:hypothetical protein